MNITDALNNNPELVGLWKFREFGKKPVWCTTYTFKGYYYDTPGKATPEAALKLMLKNLRKLKDKDKLIKKKDNYSIMNQIKSRYWG